MSQTAFGSSQLGAFVNSPLHARDNLGSFGPSILTVSIEFLPTPSQRYTLNNPVNRAFLAQLVTALESYQFPDRPQTQAKETRSHLYQVTASINANAEVVNPVFTLVNGVSGNVTWDPLVSIRGDFGWSRCDFGFQSSVFTGTRIIGPIRLSKVRMHLTSSRFPACVQQAINGSVSCESSRLTAPGSGVGWVHSGDRIDLMCPTPDMATVSDNLWTAWRRADVRHQDNLADDTMAPCCNI